VGGANNNNVAGMLKTSLVN